MLLHRQAGEHELLTLHLLYVDAEKKDYNDGKWHVPVHFENNRVQLLQWLLPLCLMRKQSVYDSDWNFSYHPEPEESGHVWIIYGNRFCVRNQLVVTRDKLT